jgi:hypothetical protein
MKWELRQQHGPAANTPRYSASCLPWICAARPPAAPWTAHTFLACEKAHAIKAQFAETAPNRTWLTAELPDEIVNRCSLDKPLAEIGIVLRAPGSVGLAVLLADGVDAFLGRDPGRGDAPAIIADQVNRLLTLWQGTNGGVAKPRKVMKRKRTSAEKRARRERRKKYMTVFLNGKQKRVLRPLLIDGLPVDEFIARNADPSWLHENHFWDLMPDFDIAS